MNHKGHAGLTLLVFSLLMLPFGPSENAIIVIVLAAGLSSLPDIDIQWKTGHRKHTHNVLAGLVVGIAFGLLFFYSASNVLWGVMGFVVGFGGIICHLLGDAFTYMKFKPLWPFSDRKIGLGWFESGSKQVNNGMMMAGSLGFVFYLLVTTGTLEKLIFSFSIF